MMKRKKTEQNNNDEAEAAEDETEHAISYDDEGDSAEQIPLRKSSRVSKKPSYLDDYVCLAEAEGGHLLLLINDEPWELEDAVKEKVWRDTCEDDIS